MRAMPSIAICQSTPRDGRLRGTVVTTDLALASVVRDDPSTLLDDDRFPRACMHRDHNAR